ncbi:MAG: hypothetical protein K8U57_04465 [Planctomycetes bacterium]|nr:hypothetical protein [Planctomycetota bacterium]
MCQADCPLDEPHSKTRERRHASQYLYVRKARGRVYQCRIWITGIGSLNLGCYQSEWLAGQASKAFARRFRPDIHLADVIASLRRDGIVPAHVLMKYVYRLPGGDFGAKVKKHGRKIVLPGPYPTEKEAYEAMRARLAELGTMRKPSFVSKGLVTRWTASQRLGITRKQFEQFWDSVFSDPRRPAKCESPNRMVIATELEVALEFGGGVSDEARSAVALFRMGAGRM